MLQPKVAVLGAGIMGCATALFLARGGARVTLLDAAPRPFEEASRWNEGKIHLGFLYAADPSLESARQVLEGGLTFRPLVEQLIGSSIEPAITPQDDLYFCHAQSVVSPEAMADYLEKVTALARAHPNAADYLVPLTAARSRRLTARELSHHSGNPALVAGFQVPERSVSTLWLAGRFVSALEGEPGIELAMNRRVAGLAPMAEGWRVDLDDGSEGPFDVVVNALWQGKLEIDATAGLEAAPGWSHRYRLSLFVSSKAALDIPSRVIATGPFGDVKNYNGRDFYLSWYPAGLLLESEALAPPPAPRPNAAEQERIESEMLRSLTSFFPDLALLGEQKERSRLAGGWVFAAGRGSLADPKATLHQRDAFGIRREGSYFSVDTGKYSSAPLLARRIADEILQG